MFTQFFKMRFKKLIFFFAASMAGPAIFLALKASIVNSERAHLIKYICKVIEPRLQVGAFREVQEFLNSSVGLASAVIQASIVLREAGRVYETGHQKYNAIDYSCEFKGRSDISVEFQFDKPSLSFREFFFSYVIFFVLLILLKLLLFRAKLLSQEFATRVFEKTLIENLALKKNLNVYEVKIFGWTTGWLYSLLAPDKRMINEINSKINELDSAIRLQSEELALHRANSEKMKLATQVAHDVRSPVSALKVAIASGNSIEATQDLIKKAIDRIDKIAEDLLQKNRKEANPLAVTIAGLESLLKEVIDEQSVIHSGEEIEILLEIKNEESEQFKINLEPNKFKRIVSNLINNAVEANNFFGKIRTILSIESGLVVIRIIDQGPGIDPAIFEKASYGPIVSKKINGSGLGLNDAIQTIQKWGGAIEFQSHPHRGTELLITLRK